MRFLSMFFPFVVAISMMFFSMPISDAYSSSTADSEAERELIDGKSLDDTYSLLSVNVGLSIVLCK